MFACEGKLTHLGLFKSPAKSTLSDANTHMHLVSYVDLFGFIKNTYKAWKKANPPPTIFNT